MIQFVCFILPAAFALRLHSNERLILSMFERLAAWSLALGGFIVGVLSTYVTILEIVQGWKEEEKGEREEKREREKGYRYEKKKK